MTQAATRPSRARFALIVTLGPPVFPLITLLLYAVFPLTDGWWLWQRTLLIVPVMVSGIIWGLIPAVHRHFHQLHQPARLSRASFGRWRPRRPRGPMLGGTGPRAKGEPWSCTRT